MSSHWNRVGVAALLAGGLAGSAPALAQTGASGFLIHSLTSSALYACGAAAGVCTGANCVLNVRDYGALGNGTGDDTYAIQCAINAASNTANYPRGAAVYLPRGKYPISLGSGDAGFATAVDIWGSNVRLFGDGASSVLWVPGWANASVGVLTDAYVTVGNSSRSIGGVRLEDFEILGDGGTSNSGLVSAVQFGTTTTSSFSQTVNFSGIRRVGLEYVWDGIRFIGGQDQDAGPNQSVGDYATDNYFTDVEQVAIAQMGSGFVDTMVRGNVIDGNGASSAAGIQMGGSRWLVEDNIIDGEGGGSIAALSQTNGEAGWSIISGNTIFGSGNPAINLQVASRVDVTLNTVSNSQGSGILAPNFSPVPLNQDLVIEGNVVDGYAGFGIFLGNALGVSAVTENFVRCPTDAGGCTEGIVAGAATDSYADRNAVAGATDNGSLALETLSSAGLYAPGSQVWQGRNVDLDTGIDTPPAGAAGTPVIPLLSDGGNVAPSVGGSKSWLVGQNNGGTVIEGLAGGALGETVTLLFAPQVSTGNHATVVLTDGGIDLISPFTSPDAGTSTAILVLQSVGSSGSQQWIEVARAYEAR
jgi:hypothetical protein